MANNIQPAREPELTLVIPVNNEAENIAPVLAEVIASFGDTAASDTATSDTVASDAAARDTVAYEIIFIDDGSVDGTPEVIRRSARDRPFVRLIRHARRSGKSNALITGVCAARAPWVATMDGDGQNDPADVLKLYHAAQEESRQSDTPVILAGARRKRRDTWLKRVSSRVANRVRARLLRDDTPDTGCGIKVFRRDDYLRLPRFENMHRFLPALFVMHGGRTRSVPVSDRPRAAGESKYGFHNRLWIGISDLLWVRKLRHRALPLRGAEIRSSHD
jgi:dolichol-phosphate mannosyltransferase